MDIVTFIVYLEEIFPSWKPESLMWQISKYKSKSDCGGVGGIIFLVLDFQTCTFHLLKHYHIEAIVTHLYHILKDSTLSSHDVDSKLEY